MIKREQRRRNKDGPADQVDDFVGSSSESWSDAARNAISQMSGMADSIQGVDVLSQSAEVENQEITEYRTTVRVAYTPSS